ncbi:MAG TPA: MFS transporter, partial [Acidobacteriota bacterium]|nr:MFS transporter [Acidobacteriota bacterium]
MSWQLRNSISSLRHRNFRLFFPGQFISVTGFWMQNLALSWLVYRLTHSTAYLGAISFSQQIPVLLLALPAGAMADRTDRHRMIILTQSLALLQATILAALTFTGKASIPSLFLLSILLGIISAFDLPARQAFLVQMVGRQDLMNAIALNSSMFNAARMIGPAIAGIVVARWGEAFCFSFNAVSYVAVLLALLKMKIEIAPARNLKRLDVELMEGFHFIRRTTPVRAMLLLL